MLLWLVNNCTTCVPVKLHALFHREKLTCWLFLFLQINSQNLHVFRRNVSHFSTVPTYMVKKSTTELWICWRHIKDVLSVHTYRIYYLERLIGLWPESLFKPCAWRTQANCISFGRLMFPCMAEVTVMILLKRFCQGISQIRHLSCGWNVLRQMLQDLFVVSASYNSV